MNPLLQLHLVLYGDDLGTIMDTAVPEAGRLAASSSTNPDGRGEFLTLTKRTSAEVALVRDAMWSVMQEWLHLAPPDQARQFQRLVLEMMQLRYRGVQTAITAFEMLAIAGIESFLDLDQEGADLFDESDRLFLDVLAEARKLGNVVVLDNGSLSRRDGSDMFHGQEMGDRGAVS